MWSGWAHFFSQTIPLPAGPGARTLLLGANTPIYSACSSTNLFPSSPPTPLLPCLATRGSLKAAKTEEAGTSFTPAGVFLENQSFTDPSRAFSPSRFKFEVHQKQKASTPFRRSRRITRRWSRPASAGFNRISTWLSSLSNAHYR